MNYNQILRKSAKHYDIAMATIHPLSEKLRDFLEDNCADIFYQPSDGWCIVYGDNSNNAQVALIDFKKLFELSKEDAIEYLDMYSI